MTGDPRHVVPAATPGPGNTRHLVAVALPFLWDGIESSSTSQWSVTTPQPASDGGVDVPTLLQQARESHLWVQAGSRRPGGPHRARRRRRGRVATPLEALPRRRRAARERPAGRLWPHPAARRRAELATSEGRVRIADLPAFRVGGVFSSNALPPEPGHERARHEAGLALNRVNVANEKLQTHSVDRTRHEADRVEQNERGQEQCAKGEYRCMS
jgi:hypothetical protein